MNNETTTVTIAWTGASGARYGLRLLEEVLKSGYKVFLLYSQAARIIMDTEVGLELSSNINETQEIIRRKYNIRDTQLQVFGLNQWSASIASGSNLTQSMVICPCTTNTMSSIANGLGNNLIERSAHIMLKEVGRKLILVIRETPFSAIHLKNMLQLARSGVIIMPANPGFYFNPKSIDDIVNFMVARILDNLNIPHQLIPRWGRNKFMLS